MQFNEAEISRVREGRYLAKLLVGQSDVIEHSDMKEESKVGCIRERERDIW